MNKALIPLTNGYKSIFAARQRYHAGRMTKAEFNHLVMFELGKKATLDCRAIHPCWHWMVLMGCYFDLKRLGIE